MVWQFIPDVCRCVNKHKEVYLHALQKFFPMYARKLSEPRLVTHTNEFSEILTLNQNYLCIVWCDHTHTTTLNRY